MNKADIINKVHEVLGTTKADAERAVETVFGSIESAMKDGVQVSVAGFGILKLKCAPLAKLVTPALVRLYQYQL